MSDTTGAGGSVATGLVDDADAPVGSVVSLLASRCPRCSRAEFPALATCPACTTPTEPTTLGPDAILQGFTEVLHPPPGAKVEVPYTIGVAAFDANLAVMGLMESHHTVDQLRIGDALHVVLVAYGSDTTYGYRVL